MKSPSPITCVGSSSMPAVWTIADALSHFAPSSVLHQFGAKQLRSIQQPLVYLQYFPHGAFKAIASFPVSEDTQIDLGIKCTGEFVILTHRGPVNPYELPDWEFLAGSLTAQARTVYSIDQGLLRQHLTQQWARAIGVAKTARRLAALLVCWHEPGVHRLMASILAALYAEADLGTVRLLRSLGSRSAAVYNWLCVVEPLRAIRHAALHIEPALLAHALCHRNACNDRLLKAVDQREPLRGVIRQAFWLNHAEIRYLNRVAGTRELSAEVFETLMRHVAPLPPAVRPTTYKAASALALSFKQRMGISLPFLFPTRLCAALGEITALQHRQVFARTWTRFVIDKEVCPIDPDMEWLWADDPDFEEDVDDALIFQEPGVGNAEKFGLQVPLTADDVFEEWLLGLPYQKMCGIHLKLCRLSVSKRYAYIEHWRYAVLGSLQRFTAMPALVPKLVTRIAKAFGFGTVQGQAVELITATELAAWNDSDWQFVPLTCTADFQQAAMQLDNCIVNPTYLHKVMVLHAFYVRLTRRQTGEETLIEFELPPSKAGDEADGHSEAAGLGFTIAEHLGIGNRAATRTSMAKAVEFRDWLNGKFNATTRGKALVDVRREIRSALARYLAAHRKESVATAAAQVHAEALRSTSLH